MESSDQIPADAPVFSWRLRLPLLAHPASDWAVGGQAVVKECL